MKKLIALISLLSSTMAFATGGFSCVNGDIEIRGMAGAGGVLLGDVTITAGDKVVTVTPSMKWIDYDRQELRILAYDAIEDVEQVKLIANDEQGKLQVNVDGLIINKPVQCILE